MVRNWPACVPTLLVTGLAMSVGCADRGQSTPDEWRTPGGVVELQVSPRPYEVISEPVVTIDGDVEAYGGVTPGNLARDSRGQFYHISAYTPYQFLVFTPAGRFRQAVGRRGRGPGEFENLWRMVVGAGDTLSLFDQQTGYCTVLGPDWQVVQSLPLGARVLGATWLSPDRIVLNVASAGPGSIRLLQDGVLTPRLLGASGIVGQPNSESNVRPLARESDTLFWSGFGNAYRFQLRSVAGAVVQELHRQPEWFRQADPATLEGAINPLVRDLVRDESGYLWISFQVRDPRWSELIEWGPEFAPGRRSLKNKTSDPWAPFDTVIEVVDPHSGTVIATRRFDRIVQFAAPGWAYHYEEDGLGQGRLVVSRIALRPTG